MSIWDIKFIFDLAALDPRMCSMWAGGMGNQLEQSNVQFLLIDNKLCQEHIVFQLSPNSGGITIISGSKVAKELYVNGDAVNDGQTVLGGVTRISIHGLQFRLEYLPHSYTPEWHIQRDNFIKAAHRGKVADTLHLTRSAPSESWRCAGWTLQKEIGRGAEGVVYAATHKDDVVGVFKRVERTPRNAQAEAERTEMLTDFSAEVDKAVRGGVRHCVIKLIALHEATLEIEEKEALYYAYKALCNETLHDHTFSTRDPCILRKRAMLFKSVLRALDFVQSCGYIHRDIKPANIGVKDGGHAVLLDLDQMILQKGHPDIPASPGVCGTLAYLAPESEMIAHSYLVDVWSAGLVLFQMMYGYHPWKFMTNPFRSDEPDELVRSLFDRQYDEIIAMLKRSRNPLDPLLVRLLAHEYSNLNPGPRPSAKEALANPVWMNLKQWEQADDLDGDERLLGLACFDGGSTTVELSIERKIAVEWNCKHNPVFRTA
ncbi:kinase-like domain-containing protein [Boeremia exigua]|uniref:kinase-like domain-containing protein n=1 Tax=Boeremia exigua TaxID=749465 RepID=UPI001E8D7681|nr:kinase-like domain-containing protein [Boeremia exigua]KAH6613099.1 kinase-like domain-containing protein [Boeremia exigua]